MSASSTAAGLHELVLKPPITTGQKPADRASTLHGADGPYRP